MNIKKAIITAAGKAQRMLPLQTLVDRDGTQKTALRIIVEEMVGMISAQRSYEINSKVISTADDMLRAATQMRG